MTKIPIRNIYYLLCYAWDKLEEADVVDVSQDDFQSVADLFGSVLVSGVTHLLKRGLDRDYVTEGIDTPTPRGKLDISTTLKRNLQLSSRLHCVVDSLTHDVQHNRIIKTTLGKVVRCDNLDRGLRDRLLRLYRRLHEISDVELSPRAFDRVRLHRNNRYYGFLLALCRLIYENRLVDERPGSNQFRDFARDERAMNRMFERFLFNFYRREQKAYRVRSQRFAWQNVIADEDALAFLPTMRTDVSLLGSDRQVVVDAKYYAETLQSHHSKQTVRSGHLFQLFAYLRNCAAMETCHVPVEGILIYPVTQSELDLQYELHGHKVRVVTVDLRREWRDIRDRLLSLVP